jgi:hypothetical protein
LIASRAPLNGTTPIAGTQYTDATALNGTTYQYVVTAVDATGHESVASSPVAATPTAGSGGPGTPTTYASDSFPRSVANGWGTAAIGGTWLTAGNNADFAVNGSAATMRLPAAKAYRGVFLNSVSAADVDLSFRVTSNKNPTGGPQYVYAALRRTTTGSFYRVTLRIAPSGQVFIGASTVINNSETTIASAVAVPGLTYSAGTFINVHAQLSGTNPTTIKLRAWASGTAEPLAWQYSATNSNAALQGAGSAGLEGYLASANTNGPAVLTFDDYVVTTIP